MAPGGEVALKAEVVGPWLGQPLALGVRAATVRAAVRPGGVLPAVAAAAVAWLADLPGGVLLPSISQQRLRASHDV